MMHTGYYSQTEADNTIAIRMFQYGSEIAVEEAKLTADGLHVEMPNAAVIFLRCNNSTSDRLMIHVKSPEGDEISYPIHVLRIKDYTIDELFEKELYILIPFYLFNLEKSFALYDSDEQKRRDLMIIFIEIRTRLEQLAEEGKLSTYNQCIVRGMSNKVAQNLTKRYENVQKGIGDIMGGKIIDMEETRILNEGIDQTAKLMGSLAREGRFDDIIRAADDKEYLRSMLPAYNNGTIETIKK